MVFSPADIIDLRCVLLDMQEKRRKHVIAALVAAVGAAGHIDDVKGFTDDVLDREKKTSTGIGRGVAIPHKLDRRVERTVMAFGRTSRGVAFDAIDGQPVRLFFLILGPEGQPNEHLQLLSRLSRLLHRDECIDALMRAQSPSEVKAILTEEEAV